MDELIHEKIINHITDKTTVCVLVLKSGFEIVASYSGDLIPDFREAQAYNDALLELSRLEDYVDAYTR